MSYGKNILPPIGTIGGSLLMAAAIGVGVLAFCAYTAYTQFRIDIPAKHIGVLTRKTGIDIDNADSVAPDADHKGLQKEVLPEGRYFLDPFRYDWKVYPMVEIPEGKLGVRIRLYGNNLPYGHFLATTEEEKGIVADVLRPGRYAYNAILKDEKGQIVNPRVTSDFVEIIELHDPVTIPAGFKGILTNLAGPIPTDNKLTVKKGERGVQEEALDSGTYYLNPYQYRVQAIDCRSQRFDLSTDEDMGFPSKDGFWVTLDGVIEFRIKPGFEAEAFVLYNEDIDATDSGSNIGREIIAKVITPNARSFCRIQGSNSTGKQLIGGDTRVEFQMAFQKAIQESCDDQGIEVLQALLTKIKPPEAIADPVRKCEIAKQQQQMFLEQKKQQHAEAKLATQKAMVEQGQKLVEADQGVVKVVQKSKQEQEVAMEGANRDLEVAIEEFQASKDTAAALLSGKQAEAAVTLFENQADASGWQRSIDALGGDGNAFARYVLYRKLAPSYRSMQINTADSPLMKIFEDFTKPGSDTKIDTSKMAPVQIDLPKDVVIPTIERKIRKPAETPAAEVPPTPAP